MVPYFTELSTLSRTFGALLVAFLVSMLLAPYFIKKLYELKIGQSIRDFEGFKFLLADLHKNKKNTPTMGGVLIIFSTLLSALIWVNFSHPFTWILISGMLVMGFLGAIDDISKLKNKSFRGLSGRTRLLVQFLFGCVVLSYFYSPQFQRCLDFVGLETPWILDLSSKIFISLSDYMSRLYFPFFSAPFLVTGFFGIIALFILDLVVISGSCNGVNLTDGLDGLAAGCSILVLVVLAFCGFTGNSPEIAYYFYTPYVSGSGEVSVFLAAMVGALLGFLWYNCYPAQVFMGDTGSLAIGAVIGIAALLLKKEILLGLIGAVFVIEALSVILQVASFQLFGKRIFRCAPLHHHFEYAGTPESKVVSRFWIFGFVLAIIGVISLFY